jgi:hypothetical protein
MMSISDPQPAQIPAPGLHRPLAPQWLTHLGGLGLFAVSVIDSSVIPLPLPGSTVCFRQACVVEESGLFLCGFAATTSG